MRELRDDQATALLNLRQAVGEGKRRIVMQAPTGFGKTVLASALVESARAKRKRLIYTVPAISLVDQTVEMFYSQGIRDIGVIQAHHAMTNWSEPVQICSVQTLQKHNIPEADVVVIDECHRWFTFYERWLRDPKWANRPFIGMSATPWQKGLGNYYEHLIVAATTQDLIDRGLLSDFRVFAPSHPDLSGVRTVAGDYHEGDLAGCMNQSGLVADIVQTWLKRAEGRPTLCYAVDLLHARHLQEQFKAAGVECGYQDKKTRDSDRRYLKRDFHNGTLKVVVNVGTLTTGIDWDVRCISLVRPTKSQMLFTQIVGRGLRNADGKDYCLILDHSDNHTRLGFVTDIDASHTSLYDGKTRVTDTTQKIRLPKECPQCSYMKPPGTAKCPVCAYVAEAHSKIEPTPGELAELKRKAKTLAEPLPRVFLAELRCYAIQHGYKPGWSAVKFKDKFGYWPDRSMEHDPPALIVSPQTANWIKSRNIAWARSKARADRLEGVR